MKRIALCLDGTWNTVMKTASTNVVRFAQSIRRQSDDGAEQIVYYNPGVGTDGPVDKVLGGVFGVGLKRNVQRAYMFAALNYRPGDELYVFGFSRGAYTARAVAGIITKVGLMDPKYFDRFEDVWQSYRRGAPSPFVDPNVRVHCVGVWDTVGSYGIPAGLGLGALSRLFTSYELGFHDTHLSDKVDVALHGLAIDEHRRPFTPTLWTRKKDTAPREGQTCEQVWFAGAHSNVGGGYPDHGLSDLAMVWMMGRVSDLTGLRFDPPALKDEKVVLNVAAPVVNSLKPYYLVSRLFPYGRPVLQPHAQAMGHFRNAPDPTHYNINERVHWSVQKHLGPTYQPKNLPDPLPEAAVTQPSPNETSIWQALASPIPAQ